MTTCKACDPDPPPVPRACAGGDLTPVPCAFQLGDLQTTWVTTSVSYSRKYNCVVVKGGVDHQPWTLPRLLLLLLGFMPHTRCYPKIAREHMQVAAGSPPFRAAPASAGTEKVLEHSSVLNHASATQSKKLPLWFTQLRASSLQAESLKACNALKTERVFPSLQKCSL